MELGNDKSISELSHDCAAVVRQAHHGGGGKSRWDMGVFCAPFGGTSVKTFIPADYLRLSAH